MNKFLQSDVWKQGRSCGSDAALSCAGACMPAPTVEFSQVLLSINSSLYTNDCSSSLLLLDVFWNFLASGWDESTRTFFCSLNANSANFCIWPQTPQAYLKQAYLKEKHSLCSRYVGTYHENAEFKAPFSFPDGFCVCGHHSNHEEEGLMYSLCLSQAKKPLPRCFYLVCTSLGCRVSKVH